MIRLPLVSGNILGRRVVLFALGMGSGGSGARGISIVDCGILCPALHDGVLKLYCLIFPSMFDNTGYRQDKAFSVLQLYILCKNICSCKYFLLIIKISAGFYLTPPGYTF